VGVVGVVSVVVVLIGLFGMAAFHAVIIEGQRDLERLDVHAVELRAQNDRLEVEVAALLAPGRIEAEAKARLGMVDPTDVTYLAPAPVGPPAPSGP
jgi:cell division protein FtsB